MSRQMSPSGVAVELQPCRTAYRFLDTKNGSLSITSQVRSQPPSSCALLSFFPTSTGSAKAIGDVIPELKGKLNGFAVRIPVANSSMTDITVELSRPTTAEAVNAAFQKAATSAPLQGILGYEERGLVSTDYVNDDRSTIVDAPSTLIVDGTHLKVYSWYDNEWGYSMRMADVALMVMEKMA